MLYRPLQFFTLMLGSAIASSVLTIISKFLGMGYAIALWSIIILISFCVWAYWWFVNEQATYTEICLVAIILGVICGLWL